MPTKRIDLFSEEAPEPKPPMPIIVNYDPTIDCVILRERFAEVTSSDGKVIINELVMHPIPLTADQADQLIAEVMKASEEREKCQKEK